MTDLARSFFHQFDLIATTTGVAATATTSFFAAAATPASALIAFSTGVWAVDRKARATLGVVDKVNCGFA